MSAFIDLTGRVFQRWTVIERVPHHTKFAHWLCRCACGKELVIASSRLINKATRSCGCLRRDILKNGGNKQKGQSAAYIAWDWLVRSGEPFVEEWEEWSNFIRDMGPCPKNHHLIRKDGSLPNSKENCEWKEEIIQKKPCHLKGKVSKQRIDLTGKVFGKLTVLRFSHKNEHGHVMWLCQCSCSAQTEIAVASHHLRNGATTSCHCARSENATRLFTTHGKYGTREHRAWIGMQKRCCNPNNSQYHDYGGRGIIVCERWRGESGFQNFLDDMGPCPKGYSLDRYPNMDGNYEPENCRWATKKEQIANRRNTVMVTYKGETLPITQWADQLGMNRATLYGRIFIHNWPIEEAMDPTLQKRRKVVRNRTPERQARQDAVHAVHVALRHKKISRPPHCSHPGCQETKLEAHHYKGYDKENWLEVQWFCKQHHPREWARLVTFNGETHPIKEWASRLGISPAALRARLRSKSWALEEAMTTGLSKSGHRPKVTTHQDPGDEKPRTRRSFES